MSGGQFGGAGASRNWGRRGGNYNRASRGGSFRRRSAQRSRGATFHTIYSSNITNGTAEDTAIIAMSTIVQPHAWLDRQWDATVAADVYEGNFEGTLITHGNFQFSNWCSNYAEGAQLFLPTFVALTVMPWRDAGGTHVGDWANALPVELPNLFMRDWGHTERTRVTADPSGYYPLQRGRTIHRHYALIDATDLAFGQAGRMNRHSWTLRKRIWIPAGSALWAHWGAYNIHLSTVITMGVQFAGTFGYIHRRRA